LVNDFKKEFILQVLGEMIAALVVKYLILKDRKV
tara:strand:- start:319 stop:420 length:102 start_codon:yes stop_codon:yes gene_type:complete